MLSKCDFAANEVSTESTTAKIIKDIANVETTNRGEKCSGGNCFVCAKNKTYKRRQNTYEFQKRFTNFTVLDAEA